MKPNPKLCFPSFTPTVTPVQIGGAEGRSRTDTPLRTMVFEFITDRSYTTTSVRILATLAIWIGRPWASATPQHPQANDSNIGGKSYVAVLGFLVVGRMIIKL